MVLLLVTFKDTVKHKPFKQILLYIFTIAVFSGFFVPSGLILGSNSVYADDVPGTSGDDNIDSGDGNDRNFGDSQTGDGSGDDNIDSGDGNDQNFGDSEFGDGSGDDKIKSGKGNDHNYGDSDSGVGTGDDKINAGQGDDLLIGGGADKFKCGSGEDTTTDYNPDDGNKATGNCEDVNKG